MFTINPTSLLTPTSDHVHGMHCRATQYICRGVTKVTSKSTAVQSLERGISVYQDFDVGVLGTRDVLSPDCYTFRENCSKRQRQTFSALKFIFNHPCSSAFFSLNCTQNLGDGPISPYPMLLSYQTTWHLDDSLLQS